MKIRVGYVSNSSSSSYVCEVCGHAEAGYDISPCDVGMCECANNHIFCEDHELAIPPITAGELKGYLRDWSEQEIIKFYPDMLALYQQLPDLEDDCNLEQHPVYRKLDLESFVSDLLDGRVRSVCCPICMLKELSVADGFQFLKKIHRLTDEDILVRIRNRFKTYEELRCYLNE